MTTKWFPRAKDVAAMGIGVLVAADALVIGLGNHQVPLAVWSCLAGLIGAAALWWRRSHPVEVMIVALLVNTLGLIEWPLAVAIFTLTIRRRDRVTWALGVAAVLSLSVEYCVNRGGFYPGAALAYSLPWIAFFGFGGAVVGMRRDRVDALRERAERAEAEQELRAEQARLNERTRIAREMHDVLAHRISLVALHAGGLEVTEDPKPEAVHKTAALIRETSRQALEDLRSVLGVLHSTGDPTVELAPQPRFADIADLVASSNAAGVPVTLTLTGPLHLGTEVPEPMGRAAYRVVQESLTNIHKHARGATTEVRLAGRAGGRLDIAIENQRPLTHSLHLPGAGSGLVGLRERVAFVGGRLSAGPTTVGGFLVTASLPWPKPGGKEPRPITESPADQRTDPAATDDPRPAKRVSRSAARAAEAEGRAVPDLGLLGTPLPGSVP